jgi:hypothetical protein
MPERALSEQPPKRGSGKSRDSGFKKSPQPSEEMRKIIKGLDGSPARGNEHATERVYGPRWPLRAATLTLVSLALVLALFGWFVLIVGGVEDDARFTVFVFTIAFSACGLFLLYGLFHVKVILTPDFVIVRDLIERRVRRSEVSAFDVIQYPFGQAFRLHCGPDGNKRVNVPGYKFDSEWFAWLDTVKCLNPSARTESRSTFERPTPKQTSTPETASAAAKNKVESLRAEWPLRITYRGFTFAIDGEYDVLHDDKNIIRGIWYRHAEDIKNEMRNKMVLAHANTTRGLTFLESDYYETLTLGRGGVEELETVGGSILWFASARELK